jgi:segregation and condensation protein B
VEPGSETVELDEGVAVAEDEAAEPERAAPERPREPADEHALERQLGALLFASPEPLTTARLAKLCDDAQVKAVEAALERLGQKLAAAGLPFELCAIAGGWQLLTSSDTAACVARLAKTRKEEKVSPASLETLAIVAYRQPVTKAEIEAIRGVQVGPILRSLVDRGLVRVAGRSDVPGHPLVYATTKKFLEAFGLGTVGDLPRDSELLRD